MAEANDAVSPQISTAAVTSPTTSNGGGGGLMLSITEAMRSFLATSSTDTDLSEDLRDLSSSLRNQSTAPYESLKRIWLGSKPDSRPGLTALLSGSGFVFTSPAPREKVDSIVVGLEYLDPTCMCMCVCVCVFFIAWVLSYGGLFDRARSWRRDWGSWRKQLRGRRMMSWWRTLLRGSQWRSLSLLTRIS